MRNFTKKQLERQDFVDNKIFELIQELTPESRKLEWDIEVISSIREEIRKYLVIKNKQ